MTILSNTRDFLLSPSLFAADFWSLGTAIRAIEEGGAHWLHLDIMDHRYVPQLSFGSFLCRQLCTRTALPMDVHLMVDDNDRYVDEFLDAGAHSISFHPSNSHHPHRLATHIRHAGVLAGIALTPTTPIEVLDTLLDDIDFVLCMTVNPGYSGQTLIPAMYRKLIALNRYLESYQQESGRHIPIQVDGGITADNISSLYQSGARLFVLGSAIFHQKQPADQQLKHLIHLLTILRTP